MLNPTADGHYSLPGDRVLQILSQGREQASVTWCPPWSHQQSSQPCEIPLAVFRRADSLEVRTAKYPHESPGRLDAFWQRPALTPRQSPQVSKSGRVDFFPGFSKWSLPPPPPLPSGCLPASEAREKTRGPSRDTQLEWVTSALCPKPRHHGCAPCMERQNELSLFWVDVWAFYRSRSK